MAAGHRSCSQGGWSTHLLWRKRTAGVALVPASHPPPFLAPPRPPSYSFLYDDKMPEEREELRAALKKAKGQAARAELQVGAATAGLVVGGRGSRAYQLPGAVCDSALTQTG